MSKKIAVINDLSGFGRCSLTAAVSVLAAMGVQPCPLPTAILSAQTGYPSYYYDDYTEKMDKIREEWEKMGASFDGIYTGFMSGCRQIRKTLEFLDSFHGGNTFFLADPVMGDNGKKFGFSTDEFQAGMKELVRRADLITPNLTELCLLAGADDGTLRELTGKAGAAVMDGKGREGLPKPAIPARRLVVTAAEELARDVMSIGPSEVLVTGIRFLDESSGEERVGNLTVTEDRAVLCEQPYIGESYSGTGDLFASVIAGGKARGDALEDSAALAGKFIAAAVRDAVKNKIPRNEGVEYEKHLRMLLR